MKANPQLVGPLPHSLGILSGEFFLTQYIGIYMAKLTCFLTALSDCYSTSTVKDQPFCVHNYALETISNAP